MHTVTTQSSDFELHTTQYRHELLAHCYRMLGSLHDAEDVLQETMLRAWRAYDRFDDTRASLRTWLYRIATNACLTALQGRQRRPLPSALSNPWDDTQAPLIRGAEVPWLQPFPDSLLMAEVHDPATQVAQRGTMRLAFVAALQHLPARQRAVLIMRDVLMWSAAEVAEALDTTPVAVNSALQRAHMRLEAVEPRVDEIAEPTEAASRTMVDRYMRAFERADIPALTQLLTDDVVMEMPPILNWFRGRGDYGRFIGRSFAMRGTDWLMIPTAANGQPAGIAYVRDAEGLYRIHTLQVFTTRADGICRNTVFQDQAVFDGFRLAPTFNEAGK